jgi:hypothetical protein
MGAGFLKCFQREKNKNTGAARNIEGELEQKHCGEIIFRARSP